MKCIQSLHASDISLSGFVSSDCLALHVKNALLHIWKLAAVLSAPVHHGDDREKNITIIGEQQVCESYTSD